tara:strand:- start:5929 stop:7008 length:1080 start_codon:yes stop_codon:yes gene_type:complete
MIDTNRFIEALIIKGYDHLCVVPCSFAKNLINASINCGSKIEYIPCASEGVACSIAAGLKIAGKNPIIISQSSGLTNMGSCITSLLSPYGIFFPILVSWRTYKEGDSEVQHKHLAKALPDLVHAYGYEFDILNKNNLNVAIEQILECNNSRKICILENKSFSDVNLEEKHKLDLSNFLPRSNYLKFLNNKFKNSKILFIGTTGNTSREMYSYMPDTQNFYMAGNMGGALSLGFGASKAGKNVFICGGDAEFVMHLGGLTTAGRYNGTGFNLTYILFDNESNKSTGGQKTQQNHLKYIGIAKSAGITCFEFEIKKISEFSKAIDSMQKLLGIKFIHVKCSYDEETPRPPIDKVINSNFAC